ARLERLVAQRQPLTPTGQFELELIVNAGEHDEAAVGPRDLDARIEDERKNLIEYAARSERSQTFEQRRHLPQVVDAAPTALVPEVAAKGVADNRVGAAASTEPHPIAGREH